MPLTLQGEEGLGEEEAEDKRKEGHTGIPTSGADVPRSLLQSGMWKGGSCKSFYSQGCGKEGAAKELTELRKVKFVGEKEVYFFC